MIYHVANRFRKLPGSIVDAESVHRQARVIGSDLARIEMEAMKPMKPGEKDLTGRM